MVQKVIAIDGPSGVGKSSVSKGLAKELGWTYLDTGAMYRAVTYAWCKAGKQIELLEDKAWLGQLELDFSANGMMLQSENIEKDIRTPEVTKRVSQVAAVGEVRHTLTHLQRRIAEAKPCILDGRDIGTVVFPEAFLKVFLMADPMVRAKRRWLQMGGESSDMNLETVLADQLERDKQDREREIAPLTQASDAWVVHTDEMSQAEVVNHILKEAQKRLANRLEG